jgi:hypothetical protein
LQALLEIPPHLLVEFFEMADKPRRINDGAWAVTSLVKFDRVIKIGGVE